MKTKIVHIQLLPIMSGVQRVTYNIFKELDKNKFDVHLICSDDPYQREESLISKSQELGVTVHLIKGLKREVNIKDISVFKQVKDILKREEFDIVHTHTSKMGIIGRILARKVGVKRIIHTMHGIAFHPYEKLWKKVVYYLCEMYASRYCDKLVLVNRGYRKTFWFTLKKLVTIYNGIDINKLRVKDNYDKEISLVFLGRLDFQKDPITILKAINLVVKRGYRIKAKFVGDGELTDMCDQYIQKWNLQDNVELLGWRDDVSEVLDDSNVFCSSSLYEALPLSFLEAAYSGLPTIGTDIIGVREVVVKDMTGYLYKPRDYIGLSELLIRLIENPDLVKNMGQNAHNFVSENFSLEKMVEGYLELYRDC